MQAQMISFSREGNSKKVSSGNAKKQKHSNKITSHRLISRLEIAEKRISELIDKSMNYPTETKKGRKEGRKGGRQKNRTEHPRTVGQYQIV